MKSNPVKLVENTAHSQNMEKNGTKLPDMAELPNADVLIYDGRCNFCRSQVAKLNWFAAGQLAFISLHDPRVAENFPDLTKEQLMKQMYVVNDDGLRIGGAAAVKYLSRKFPRLWFAFPAMHVPFMLPVWQYLYDKIAKYRYLISGKSDCDSDSCQIHFDK